MSMSPLRTVGGALRYEFLMQIRRPSLWLTFLVCALLISRSFSSLWQNPIFAEHLTTLQLAALVTLLTNWLAPLGVGILLADRLPRDRRVRIEELFNTFPEKPGMRIVGKYLGTLLASLVPAFLLFLLIVGFVSWRTGDFSLILCGLLCYLVIVLPGMCFLAAFSLACPAVIWVPLYQFLFFGYWFWGNILSPGSGLPTLSNTILTPIGSFIAASFFHVSTYGGRTIATFPFSGVIGVVTLVGIAVLVLCALIWFLRFEQARQ